MRKRYRDGKIVVVGKFFEDANYDVASNDLHVKFDGKGGITDYTVVNQSVGYVTRTFLGVFIKGENVGAFCDKTVEVGGRMQKILLKKGNVLITVLQFVPVEGNAVLYEIKANKTGDYDFVFDLGKATNRFNYAANVESRYVAANASVYLHTDKSAHFVLSYDTDATYCRDLLSRFISLKKQVVNEFRNVKVPASAKTEKDKALYKASFFSALENYKAIGAYKGFSAVSIANDPVRSYFQDTFTVAPAMLKTRPALVKDQILTIAHGIKEDGECPAGVTFRLQPHLRYYYDSASCFVLSVYDYINHTGDLSLLDEIVNGRSVYQLCLLSLDKLSGYEDETGLIVKSGKYNKQDWADEINRTGYVTYVELLYARALECLSLIAGTRDKTRAARYRRMFLRTKNAVNELLWDDEKGYYINYRDGDFVEDNLSVDTILAILYRVADKKQTERLLDNFSALLETRNNRAQTAGDFGVMSVWPFYRGVDRLFNLSTQQYEYLNGAAWPYWSALVAYAQKMNGRDPSYALLSPLDWCVKHGCYTLAKCYSPCGIDDSPLFTSNCAFVWYYDWADEDYFKENESVFKTK